MFAARVIYDDLRVVDCTTGIAGAYCAKLLTDLGADVVFTDAHRRDPLFTYLRTSQRHAPDPSPWLAAADIVITGEPGPRPRPRHRSSRCRSPRSATAAPTTASALPEEVLQARSGSLSTHGHMDLPPLTVGGDLGEYIVGAFAALGAATAWWRASRTGVPETVDVSMLEAMQMTYVTTPTLMARFPGGRLVERALGDDSRQRADGRRSLRRHHDRHRRAVVGVVRPRGPRRPQERRRAHHDDRSVPARRRSERHRPGLDTRAHDADEIVAACVEARVPATIVGNGAELPRYEQLEARDVFVPQPGEAWIRPRAPFRFHGVADRALAAPGPAANPWPARAPRVPNADPPGERPLAGVQVLDFTAFWAGPFATAWLSAIGADVIKVEAVQRPDGIRFSAAVRPHRDPFFYEKSGLFHASNLGKRGITLDLGHPDGLAIAQRLVARSDVVVENFTPQVLERFGLDCETVHGLRPDIVMLRMPAFGLTVRGATDRGSRRRWSSSRGWRG